MGDDLKPCPWCGRVPVLTDISGGGDPAYWVECDHCDAAGPADMSGLISRTVGAWNRRPVEEALRARAEAAEQRAEAAEAALTQARADRTLMAGLWLVTVPPRELPALLPTDQGDRDRLAAALDAVDRQPGAEARIAAGRAVIARIVAETGGGAA